MGTRGIMGVRIDGADRLSYVQFDSYPEGWPNEKLVVDLRHEMGRPGGGGLDELRRLARALRMVPEDGTPTAAEVRALGLERFHRKEVSTGADWYAYLRGLQGDLLGSLRLGVMADAGNFIRYSLSCEYAYIVNLDEACLEVYRGNQTKPHRRGRYAKLWTKEERTASKTRYKDAKFYYPCALVATFPLIDIPDNWIALAFPDRAEAAAE